MKVNVKKLYPDAVIPEYKTLGAAAVDLHAYFPEEWKATGINAGDRELIGTGIAVEIPEGYELQIRPRSGLALKEGITVLNTPGTIDSDYRGEVKVMLVNHGPLGTIIRHGDRIAQAVLAPVIRMEFEEVAELNETERGAGGFGSTGV